MEENFAAAVCALSVGSQVSPPIHWCWERTAARGAAGGRSAHCTEEAFWLSWRSARGTKAWEGKAGYTAAGRLVPPRLESQRLHV